MKEGGFCESTGFGRLGDGCCRRLQIFLLHQSNDGATESTASHPGTECTGRQRSIDSTIEFRSDHFVVITKRNMALGHELAKLGEIPFAQEGDCLLRPSRLIDDVANTATVQVMVAALRGLCKLLQNLVDLIVAERRIFLAQYGSYLIDEATA